MRKILSESHQLLNKKVLILGKNSTLSKFIYKKINKDKFIVLRIDKTELNFLKNNYKKNLKKILKKFKPDIIINCIGKFSLNKNSNMNLFQINLLPTWEIINFYMKNKTNIKVRILIIGSSSYSSPRKKYMLYASSKSALNSLVNSAIEYFDKSKIHLKIINPKTFGGKHLGKFKKKVNEDVNKVVKLVDKYISKS